RHWRKVLPPLARPRRARFSQGDLVALAAIRELVRGAGIAISAIVPCSTKIFSLCNDKSWPALAQFRLQIEGQSAQLVLVRSAPALKRSPVILLSLGPLIEELARKLSITLPAQSELRFPLTALRRQRR